MPESPDLGLMPALQQQVEVLSLLAHLWIHPRKPKLDSSYLSTWSWMSRPDPNWNQSTSTGSFVLQGAWTPQRVRIPRTWHGQCKYNDGLAIKKMKLTINVLHRSLEAPLVPVWEYVAHQKPDPLVWHSCSSDKPVESFCGIPLLSLVSTRSTRSISWSSVNKKQHDRTTRKTTPQKWT